MHQDLLILVSQIYETNGFRILNLQIENESAEYGAAEFALNNRQVKLRVSKITPTKVGQFVTFWKRSLKGPIAPYNDNDPFDLLIVSARSGKNFGQFIFPRHVLAEKGILSTVDKEGKRAMRIYPPWDIADNTQAKRTQKWQLEWFIDNHDIDQLRLKHLLN